MPAVDFEVATDDETLVALLAGPQGPVPGALHAITSGAVLAYKGPRAARGGMPEYVFLLEFGTPNVAAAAANWLWSQLHGHAVSIRVADMEVPLHHAALKDALLAAAGVAEPI
jgi:hypothetical protein